MNMKDTEKQKHEPRKERELYAPAKAEILLTLAEGILIGALVCWLCYQSIYSFPVGIIAAMIFLKLRKKQLIKKKKQQLLYHFKDLVSSLHTSLMAGYSLENALAAAAKDVETLYGSRDVLVIELKRMIAQMSVRIRVEDLFEELGERSQLEDIRMFAQLLAIGKRTGGNMSRLLMDTSHIICGKIDTKQEIDAQIASKAFEQKIMSVMPAAIIIYLRLSFSGFIEMLYGNIPGIVIMSVCLIIYGAGFYWGLRIVDVEV